MRMKMLAAAATAVLFNTGIALAQGPIATVSTASGDVFAHPSGLSLYVFDKDGPAVSNCYGDCAAKWPPFEAAGDASPEGAFGIILRTDGTRQWALNGKPLYTWFKDEKPGDVSGDGVKGVWHLAKP